MSEQAQSEQIEISMDHAKQLVAKRDLLNRLISNPDFDALITREYFDAEASRLVLARAEPGMQSDENQAIISKQMDAIGYLRNYLQGVIQIGNMAERDVVNAKEELELAEEEELADEVSGD